MRRSRHSVYRKENKPEVTGRLFFALWPPGSAAQALHGWASAAHAQTGGRITREPTIHLTLAFLGDLPLEQVATLKACAKRVQGRAFEMRLDEGRWWQHNRIVWAGPREMPEALRDLAAELETQLEAAGFRTEKREFKAHVTLVRRAEQASVLPDFEPVAWSASEFVLVRSTLTPEGPAYETLARFPLQAILPA